MIVKINSYTQQDIDKESVDPDIKKILPILPKRPGVYIFKDSRGRIIYVGKAQSLRERVKSYFQNSASVNYVNHPISFFTRKIKSIDYVVTDNEVEALVLESNLIKKNRPKYNISLKDDKSYPYVAITENEKFPRIFMTRNRNLKGAKYFGPYTSVKPVKEILGDLRKIFQLRDCKKSKPGKVKGAVCLNYHINLCSAPCVGKISEDTYRRNINYIKMFLKGSDKTIMENMKAEMAGYASRKEFEEASAVKERIEWINALLVNQKIFFSGEDAWEILSISKDSESEMAAISLFSYKGGELSAINNFIISNCKFMTEKEVIAGFLKSFYIDIDNVPSKILIPFEIEDMELISGWLSKAKGKKIEIKAPRIGEKKKIIEMASRNASLYLEKKKFEKDIGYSKVYRDLSSLKQILGLKNIPKHIECFDISNIGGSFAVGSMVVLINGTPITGNYRHFKIKTVEGQDDIAMIEEVLSRRLRYLENSRIDIENSFYIKPDLIIVDGGKAQFNIVRNLLAKKQLSGIDAASIAKKEEIIFCAKYENGIRLDISKNYMKIIIKARDEAHRFAVSYHKKLRDTYMTHSILDGIKGIGERKKKIIMEKFNTTEELKNCSLEVLSEIKGITYKDAVNIYNSFHK